MAFGRGSCLLFTAIASASEVAAQRPTRGVISSPLRQIGFVENLGQFGPEVQFVAQLPGGAIGAGANRLLVCAHGDKREDEPATASIAFALEFLGVDRRGAPTGIERDDATVNYFRGADPSRWVVGARSFRGVRWMHGSDGVEIDVRLSGLGFEYDIVLPEEADLEAVEFRVSGARSVYMSNSGGLSIEGMSGQRYDHSAPRTYVLDASGNRKPIRSKIVAKSESTFGFECGEIAIGSRVVIDPQVNPVPQPEFFTYLGDVDAEIAQDLAVASNGDIVVAGATTSADFPKLPPPAMPYQPNYVKGYDGFVARLDSLGEKLKWATYIGCDGTVFAFGDIDAVRGVAVDSEGNVYGTGITTGVTFPNPSPSLFLNLSTSGAVRCFVFKLNNTGTALHYSAILEGGSCEATEDIEVDGFGNAYVVGWTDSNMHASPQFPTTPGVVEPVFGVGATYAAFATKVNPTGTALVYSTFVRSTTPVGEGPATKGFGLDLLADDEDPTRISAVLCGEVDGPLLPTQNAFQNAHAGAKDGFVAILNHNATNYRMVSYYGGTADDHVFDVAVNSTGLLGLGGMTLSTDLPLTSAAFQPTLHGLTDGFVARVDPFVPGGAPASLLMSSYWGGTDHDRVLCVDMDSAGTIYAGGWTTSTDFFVSSLGTPPRILPQSSALGGQDGFIIRVRNAQLTGATLIGGELQVGGQNVVGGGLDAIFGIELDSAHFVACGGTRSTDLITRLALGQFSYQPVLNNTGTKTSVQNNNQLNPDWDIDPLELGLELFRSGTDAFLLKHQFP